MKVTARKGYVCGNMMKVMAIVITYYLSLVTSLAQPLDYSYCGYHHSEREIPVVKAVVKVSPSGDDAAMIQAAIDQVSRMKADKKTGFRGAVLLEEGTYTLNEPLRIRTAGVVLRGKGRDKTILRKTGYDRGALLYIEGTHERVVKDTLEVADAVAGAMQITLSSGFSKNSGTVRSGKRSLQPGSRIAIWRPSTKEWIASLGCSSFGGGSRMGYWAWHPGDVDLRWNRQVVAVNGNVITLDAPITTAIQQQWGGAKAVIYEPKGLVSECGVENLTLESAYDEALPMDENHCWDGVYIADAEDCWVRMVTFRNFAGSAVVIQKSAQQVTVEDCLSLHPVSEIGGFRRRTFLTLGEKTLFQRCYSEHGINDFAVGHTAPGPNAFVQCESFESYGPSGAISSWAPGILFDIVNIDGNDIVFKNWELEKFGAGWSTANSTMWQSTAAGLFCYSPDSLNRNFSHGCWGQVMGNGEYSAMNEHVKPYSLFADQLLKRRGEIHADEVKRLCRVMERNTEASSSPTIEEALQMAEEALKPRKTLKEWIEGQNCLISQTSQTALTSPPHPNSLTNPTASPHRYAILNGWLAKDGSVLVGGKHQTPWWNGRTTDAAMSKAKYALTRFVPGQEGTGGTDRIDSVIVAMQREHTLVFSQNYGLWTDRRRDDHERIRRKNGDVWAPFYEQPFARVGVNNRQEGNTPSSSYGNLAWDGLSKYDLTKLNKWYFWRLQQFAKKGEAAGLLLKNQHYFQHNILEAGAHWVDCPWRTANNVNGTPFLEPVNFTGDKRIFTAKQFYDVENPKLRELHRQYIRQSLDAFKGQPNVIHSIGEEFTGPLHFVQFWLDVVAEWERENGQVLVDLAVNKDVQDAILNDPVRSAVVDIIDIEQWFYHEKGEYAPPGGVNMAQRQYMRKIRTGGARFEDVYRAVSEYRSQYPDKAVIYSAQKYPQMCWAALFAGGSCAAIPVTDAVFLKDLAQMRPYGHLNGCYMLGDTSTGALVYVDGERDEASFDLPDGTYKVSRIHAESGVVSPLKSAERISKTYVLQGKGIYWLKKIK